MTTEAHIIKNRQIGFHEIFFNVHSKTQLDMTAYAYNPNSPEEKQKDHKFKTILGHTARPCFRAKLIWTKEEGNQRTGENICISYI